MKLGLRETIAVAVALVVVVGFFYFFNRPSPLNFADIGPEEEQSAAATFSPGFQELIQEGSAELVAEDLVVGEGDAARVGDELTVHYVGILTDGNQFDSSVSRGSPFTFTLGRGEVIAGWDQGLLGMREGGRRILIIPSNLAYGSRGTGNIPPNATLIFEVLLLDVQ